MSNLVISGVMLDGNVLSLDKVAGKLPWLFVSHYETFPWAQEMI